MLIIGCHLSSSKGFLAMGRTAVEIGANTFQFFTRNPRGGKAKPLDLEDIAAYLQFAKEHEIVAPLAHAPYTLNACAKDPELRKFAKETMKDDLQRLQHLPGVNYNFHPGSHVQQGEEAGIAYITETLNEILSPAQNTTVLLETMAGKGTEIGGKFTELKKIIDGVELKEHIGVCLDTCHIFDAGYDLGDSVDAVVEQFDREVGLNYLKAIHLNDSKNVSGSHKDRHEKIGEGEIGIETLTKVINHPALCRLPFYLETPNELDGYAREIAELRNLYRQ